MLDLLQPLRIGFSGRKPVSISDRSRRTSCVPTRSPQEHHCVGGWHPHRYIVTGRRKPLTTLHKQQATRSRANENARVGGISPAPGPDVRVCHDRFSVLLGEGGPRRRTRGSVRAEGRCRSRPGPPPAKPEVPQDALDHLLLINQGGHDCRASWLWLPSAVPAERLVKAFVRITAGSDISHVSDTVFCH